MFAWVLSLHFTTTRSVVKQKQTTLKKKDSSMSHIIDEQQFVCSGSSDAVRTIVTLQKTCSKKTEQWLSRIQAVRTLSAHPHPNFVIYKGVQEENDKYLIYIERPLHRTLKSYLLTREYQVVDEEIGKNIIRQIAEAMQHLHRHSVIHAHIDLENIYIDETSMNVTVGDFFLSDMPWTASYEDDIRSIGTVLYSLLCPLQTDGFGVMTNHLSRECQHLLFSLVDKEIECPSIYDVVKHPWLNNLHLSVAMPGVQQQISIPATPFKIVKIDFNGIAKRKHNGIPAGRRFSICEVTAEKHMSPNLHKFKLNTKRAQKLKVVTQHRTKVIPTQSPEMAL